jgi:hypothetical protein
VDGENGCGGADGVARTQGVAVDGDKSCGPIMAVYNFWSPLQCITTIEYRSAEEGETFTVIRPIYINSVIFKVIRSIDKVEGNSILAGFIHLACFNLLPHVHWNISMAKPIIVWVDKSIEGQEQPYIMMAID